MAIISIYTEKYADAYIHKGTYTDIKHKNTCIYIHVYVHTFYKNPNRYPFFDALMYNVPFHVAENMRVGWSH